MNILDKKIYNYITSHRAGKNSTDFSTATVVQTSAKPIIQLKFWLLMQPENLEAFHSPVQHMFKTNLPIWMAYQPEFLFLTEVD